MVLLLTTYALSLNGCASMGQESDRSARQFYLKSEPITWDYTPQGRNVVADRPFSEDEAIFTVASKERIGSRYAKCVYRAYTDSSFSSPIAQPDYMGFLGPTLHSVVGEQVEVLLRNDCSIPTSFHVHGWDYDKSSEGAPYADGEASNGGDSVAPGESYLYKFAVPDRSGPGPMEGSSTSWMYHSHVDEAADVYAGLSGFLVVTRQGMANLDGSPKDVDQEVFSLFEVVDETASQYLQENLNRAKISRIDDPAKFHESNLKHSINGYLYGNGPQVQIKVGTKVRWTVMSMGNEVDLHTPHWHGMTAVVNGMRTDVVSLLPAEMSIADITPDEVGTWLYHCHVNDHLAAGMVTTVKVTP